MSPFGYKRGEGIDAGYGEPEWIVNKDKRRYDEIFQNLSPTDGKITGACMFNNSIMFKSSGAIQIIRPNHLLNILIV